MKKCKLLISILIIICLLSGCNPISEINLPRIPANKEVSTTFFALDTVISITLYKGGNDTLLNNCALKIQAYEQLFSRTIEGSDIYRVNHANGEWTVVDPETYILLQNALYYCEKSNGVLDITISPAKDLWDFTGETIQIPDQENLQEAISHVDYHTIELADDNKVRLMDKKAAIDLGCVAKGYIADRLRGYLLNEGVTSALINLGGNVIVIGTKPDGNAFQIGIQKPFTKTGIFETTVALSDPQPEPSYIQYCTVVTSGTYERCFTKDDVLYHHILDTKTGYPVETDLSSVTILSDSSTAADALSTTCLALGFDKAKELLESTYAVKAILIKTSGEVIEVDGLPDA